MQGPYDAGRVEAVWYAEWERRGYFQPSEHESREPFVIAIPPPNITGRLHVGHVMFVSYQDLMVRWHRMRGRAALWIPGTDHAAIATQNVLERVLRDEGTSRAEIGRAALEERVARRLVRADVRVPRLAHRLLRLRLQRRRYHHHHRPLLRRLLLFLRLQRRFHLQQRLYHLQLHRYLRLQRLYLQLQLLLPPQHLHRLPYLRGGLSSCRLHLQTSSAL
mgnify:CR=1 FL=1